jgi:hypothetical protein
MANKIKDKVFQIRLTRGEHVSFLKLAESRHLTLAILIRQLLHRELDSQKVQAA